MTDVYKSDDETYEYVCPDCGFTSSGHALKKDATARGEEHMAEHEGEPPVDLTQPGELPPAEE